MSNGTLRLPEVKDLYGILPRGTDGGKEFARIVDLLLFYDARRSGKTFSAFSDVAGDYHGLDSFEVGPFRRQEQTGYQYKFYPCPLTPKHRKDIEHSLGIAQKRQEQLGLKKWILITPQDFVESSSRKDGGDVSWFETLRQKTAAFEIEHWGHRSLQSFFLETPLLCLRYYPELVAQGSTRKRAIGDTRVRYDKALASLYREILFVGIPVYKQETARGIPMQDIYIPISVTPQGSEERSGSRNRINPVTLLAPGRRQVILGDPGSGKSTLLRFMALSGSSKALQQRYKVKRDKRLPMLIILRRYADALKTRENLSLLDYIGEVLRADLSLNSVDRDFLEFYLETGQAILLLDGLDELPNPSFKLTVRDRIVTFAEVYPGNAIVVTSRIVGYEYPFRFAANEFSHYAVAKLEKEDIERFIRDWYRARIDNKVERDRNANDLVRIIHDPHHSAISELAENPLLLTIVALVHRIDAVLPDERVVLYQKCTETLLNTWHTWKYREIEVKHRGKVERRNKSRMEAIAYWMQCRSVASGRDARAVAPYAQLHEFLQKHIESKEQSAESDSASDLADEFLDFIKKRAGLLIEVGDAAYSFVHLTFQEYLTSTFLVNTNEVEGAPGIWRVLESVSDNPRWHEVVRLLIAGLKSNESQEYLVSRLLEKHQDDRTPSTAQLLGGLLLDGIEVAERRKEELLLRIIIACSVNIEAEELQTLLGNIKALIAKQPEDSQILWKVFQSKAINSDLDGTAIALIGASVDPTSDKLNELYKSFVHDLKNRWLYGKLIIGNISDEQIPFKVGSGMSRLLLLQAALVSVTPATNLLSAGLLSSQAVHSRELFYRASFYLHLASMSSGATGPYHDYTANWLTLFCQNVPKEYDKAFRAHRPSASRKFDRVLNEVMSKLRLERVKESVAMLGVSNIADFRSRVGHVRFGIGRQIDSWKLIISDSSLQGLFVDQMCNALGLKPRAQLGRRFKASISSEAALIKKNA